MNALDMDPERHQESCMICGGALAYLERAEPATCTVCGRSEPGHVICKNGHFVCGSCHGGEFLADLDQKLAESEERSPHRIAEMLLNDPDLPMLGCEHAHIAAAALLTALINSGVPGVTPAHRDEVLLRTGRQAVSAYCGLTGVCGVVPALGAAYSVLVGAQCGRGPETRATMELTARLAAATALEAEPGCCKAYVRRSLEVASDYLRENLEVSLPPTEAFTCIHMDRHPHGCRGPACAWHPDHSSAEQHGPSKSVAGPTPDYEGPSRDAREGFASEVAFRAAEIVSADDGG